MIHAARFTRRDFLKATSSAAATLAMTNPNLPALAREAARSAGGLLPRRRYRDGVELSIIGFGGIIVVGQDQAVTAVANAIRRARAGLQDPNRPLGSFIFLGPTGVGKTELARALAAFLFDDEQAMVRVDMSEYQEKHTVSRLIGAPPGYVGFDQGGLLTDGIDQHPHSVLLLDEIEKAHPDLFNILLQVMDHGKLTDHNGKQVDFRNVILIMTTNAGAQDMAREAMGFTRSVREGDDQEAIKRLFTPEFRNRLDAVIAFGHLPPEIVRKVVEKFVLQLEAQLSERQINIELSQEAADWLAAKGYDQQMGARPLARVIQEHVKKPLAEEVLFGKLAKGGTVRILLKGDGLEFTYLARNEEKALPKPPERKALQTLIDHTQQTVNGFVRLKLYKGNVIVVGRKSRKSLYSDALVTFEDDRGAYDQKDAAGFIRLNALRLRTLAARKRNS